MNGTAPAEDDVARRTVGGPPTSGRRAARKARLRLVTRENPYGLSDVSLKDLRAELERRTGAVNGRGRAKQYRETPKVIAAVIRMARAVGERVGPGMDIESLRLLAELRDILDGITGEACRELTRPNRPHGHEPGEPCVRDGDDPCTGDPATRRRYSWAQVSAALGFGHRGTAWDRYADPDGPRKRDGDPDRPRRAKQ